MKFYLPINKDRKSGFTLIELLVVITIITALAVAVFTALNPAQRLKDARDARRTTDVDQILTAIHTYIVDNKGAYPAGLTAGMSERQLGTSDGTGGANPTCAVSTGGCSVTTAACLDLSGASLLGKYLKTMPIDPFGGTTWTSVKTGYSVVVDANGLVTIKACGTGTGTTEGATNISASR